MLQFCKKVKLYTKLAPETVRSLFFISKFISDHLHITIIYKSIFFNWSITCKLNYWITCKISSRGNFIWKCPSYVWFVWLILFLFFSFFLLISIFFLWCTSSSASSLSNVFMLIVIIPLHCHLPGIQHPVSKLWSSE